MTDIVNTPQALARVARVALVSSSRSLPVLILAGLMVAGALIFLDDDFGSYILVSGITLLALLAVMHVVNRRQRQLQSSIWQAANAIAGHDHAPCFGTDDAGKILYRNRAAERRFSSDGETLASVMSEHFASAHTAMTRLRRLADQHATASEEIASSRGALRLSVHRVDDAGYFWRVEETLALGEDSSAEAMALPMMRVAKPHNIVHMNKAMQTLLGGRPVSLDRVVSRLPLQSGEPTTFQTARGPVDVHLATVNDVDGTQHVYVWPDAGPEDNRTNTDSIPVPIMRISVDGRILMANARAQKLLALDSAQNADFAEVIEGLGRPIDEWLLDVSEGRGTGRTEVVRAALPQQEVYLQVSLGRMVDRGEVSILAVLSDATEMKTLEAQFVQSQKMQAIGQLAGGVAHDFNNLLTAISGHCDLLLLSHEPGDPSYGDLVQINQNANRAASLVGQLLAFSRKQNLQPEVIDLRETLVDMTHLLNRLVGEKIHLQWSHDPNLPRVRADKRQLEQVLMNLVVNARDAMPGGGTIQIETSNASLKKPLQRDRAEVPAGEYVIVKVIDAGCGIPPDKLQKIFEPFYSTKKTGEGTGLGLSMAYGIVKQSGGFIFANSNVGTGSVFTMYFPAHYKTDTAVDAVGSTVPKNIAKQDGGTVLLVEDEAPVRAFASRALRLRGYTVIEACCAEDALDLLIDDELSIDVFVTDVVMPGMDGPTWVSQALEKRPGVKVVFVSGYAEDSVTHNRAKIPNSAFLPKPFSLNQLTDTVQQQLI